MSLLTDPAAVALVRALLAHFVADGWEYEAVRTWGPPDENGNQPKWITRTWTKDRHSKLVEWCPVYGLTFAWTNTDNISQLPITSAQQVADLLGADGIGLIPVDLTSGWRARQAEINRLREQITWLLDGMSRDERQDFRAAFDPTATRKESRS